MCLRHGLYDCILCPAPPNAVLDGVDQSSPRAAFPSVSEHPRAREDDLRAAQGARREPGIAERSVTDPPEKPVFSDRELEVLGYVADGLTNGEIARKMHLSTLTVKSHMARMFAKMPAEIPRTRAGMVGWALRNRLMP